MGVIRDPRGISIIFGSDIHGSGAVITKTLYENDFKLSRNTLNIRCSNIIEDLYEVPIDKRVWFLIRNDKTRVGSFRGLRTLAVYQKRLTSSMIQIKRKAGKFYM